MAVTDHYDFWYIDPDEEISDFPSTWNYNIDDIDAAIHAAATNNVALSRLPNLPAGKVTSGRFSEARMPSDVLNRLSAYENRIKELENANRNTGPRNINSLIKNGGDISGELGLIRSGDTVTIYATSLKMDGSGSAQLISLPTGFKPPANMQTEWCGRGGSTQYFDIYASGSVWAGRRGKDEVHAGVITYVTKDSWPSTLPGDPA